MPEQNCGRAACIDKCYLEEYAERGVTPRPPSYQGDSNEPQYVWQGFCDICPRADEFREKYKRMIDAW